MNNIQIKHVAERLEEANLAYRRGESIMSDAAYDALEDSLREAAPDHPIFTKVGAPGGDGWPKVKHPVDMGSLNKAQSDDEFRAWYRDRVPEGAHLFMTEKLDGISVLLTYVGGELESAATRGDGVHGELITRNVAIMKGVPKQIPFVGTAYIRGEIVCRKSDFATHFQGESNPRNTAAGTAKRQSNWRKAEHLTVIAYNLTTCNDSTSSRSEEFERLEEWGFQVPNHFLLQNPESAVAHRQDYITKRRGLLDYEIDGLVIEINDTEGLQQAGSHNLKPKGAVAFKFPHEASQTVLRDIVWQVGPSGRVTPVAQFDAVLLAGAQVKQASLHNVARVKKLKLFKGCKILVSRRNDVIPMVEANLDLGLGIAFDGWEDPFRIDEEKNRPKSERERSRGGW